MVLLIDAISKIVYGDPIFRHVCLPPDQGLLRSQLYELGVVQDETIDDDGNWIVAILIAKRDYERLFKNVTTSS